MSAMQETTILESNSRFSTSDIWQFQEKYFDQKGIEAWVYGVPYYVTSNVLIAYSYAQKTLRYLQDQLKQQALDVDEPIYMLELGTGSGKFSYLFLKNITALLSQYGLAHLKFRYVMTDFTDNNRRYWAEHPALTAFVEQGTLDFAIYRIGDDAPIELLNSGVCLETGTVKNPLLAVANYIFDSVPHDVFRMKDGKLYEGLISITTEKNNVFYGKVQSLEQMQTDFEFKEVDLPYYNKPAVDDILSFYKDTITEGTFLIPTGAIHAIDHLRTLSNDRLFIISADKGHTTHLALEQLATPHIAFHGSFSMMVNFDALGRYMANLGGDAKIASNTEGMKTNLLLLGDHFKHLPETCGAYEQFAQHFSTKEFLLIKNEMLDNKEKLNLQQILAMLKMSYWDSDIFMAINTELNNLLSQASRYYIHELKQGLHEIAKNYYFMPNNKNVFFDVARTFHLIGDFTTAIDFYNTSLKMFPSDSACYFNIGLCHYYQANKQKAGEFFNLALEYDPNNSAAKEWIGYIA